VTLAQGGGFRFENIEARRGRNKFVVRSIGEDGSVFTLEEIEIFYSTPTLGYLTRDLNRGPLDTRRVALTFDGGAESNATAEILEVLKRNHLRCTLFLTGRFIQRFPDLVRRMVADGHEVGNHTWSHPHLTTFATNRRHDTLPQVTRLFLQEELTKNARLFKQVTGRDMVRFWRAPYGEVNAQLREWAAEIGWRHVGWTVGRNWQESMDTLDWVADTSSPAYHSAEEIVQKILAFADEKKNGANGCIILMHLGTERNGDYPHQKLPDIIAGLQQRGYEFVTVSELAE